MSNINFALKDTTVQQTFISSSEGNECKVWNAYKLKDTPLEEGGGTPLKSGSTYVFNDDTSYFDVSTPKIVYNQSMSEDERSDLIGYLNTFNRVSKKEVCISIYPNVNVNKPIVSGYYGGVYSPTQNRIYFVPYGQSPEEYWHYIDCDDGTVQKYLNPFYNDPLVISVPYAYSGGVYSPTQNRIYFVPFKQAEQEYWQYIDCNDGIVQSYPNINTDIPVINAYIGGVYSPTQNRIYFVPYGQSPEEYWHYIDCDDGTVQKYLNPFFSSVNLQTNAYNGGVYSPIQNRIYFVPYTQANKNYWHYIDCDDGSVQSYTNIATDRPISSAYIGGVYSPTQHRIYFVPYAQSYKQYWHYIDCSDGSVQKYLNPFYGGVNLQPYAYQGGVYSPTQNRIYFVPYGQSNKDYWHYIDCNDGTVKSYSNIATNRPLLNSYTGGVYSPTQNRIYFTPNRQCPENYFHCIDELSKFPVDRGLMASECYNKF